METGAKEPTPLQPRNSGLGMNMHGKVIVELRRLALTARPNITLVHQEKNKRWMMAGEEGGGSTGDVGHYVGFVGVNGPGLAVSIPLQSLIPNTTQRKVISQEMIRAQLFRYCNTCDLLVTHHYIGETAGDSAIPSLQRRVLFHGKNGILAPGTKQPVFFDHAGEAIDFPKNLIPLIQAVSAGATTPKNKHAHCISLQPITLGSTKKPKAAATPVVEGEPIADDVLSISATPAPPANGKGSKRNKSAATQFSTPQPTVAPDEVAAQVAV